MTLSVGPQTFTPLCDSVWLPLRAPRPCGVDALRWPSLLCQARCSVEITLPIMRTAERFQALPSVGGAGKVVGQLAFVAPQHGPAKPCRPSESNS